MKRRIAWLTGASLAYSKPHVFSVAGDFLAYPQVSETSFSNAIAESIAVRSRFLGILYLGTKRPIGSLKPVMR